MNGRLDREGDRYIRQYRLKNGAARARRVGTASTPREYLAFFGYAGEKLDELAEVEDERVRGWLR